jgi:hypothetical protein
VSSCQAPAARPLPPTTTTPARTTGFHATRHSPCEQPVLTSAGAVICADALHARSDDEQERRSHSSFLTTPAVHGGRLGRHLTAPLDEDQASVEAPSARFSLLSVWQSGSDAAAAPSAGIDVQPSSPRPPVGPRHARVTDYRGGVSRPDRDSCRPAWGCCLASRSRMIKRRCTHVPNRSSAFRRERIRGEPA